MEYGEFNSINTSLVEYERTTKKLPTMKPINNTSTVEKKIEKTSGNTVIIDQIEINNLI